MKVLLHRDTFYRRIGIAVIVLLFVSQVISLISILLFLIYPGSNTFSELSLALFSALELIAQQSTPELLNTLLSRIHDVSGIQWLFNPELPGRFEIIDPLKQPGLSQAAKTIGSLSSGEVQLFSEKNNTLVWLYHTAEPHFALGMQVKLQLWIEKYIKIAFPVILLFNLLTGWWLAYRLSKPLHRLAQSALRFGKSKDIRLSVEPTDPLEFIQLAEALNTMRMDLDTQVRKREECLAGISHDLRTPLTRLRVNIELLPDSPTVSDMREDLDEMLVGLEQTVELARLDIEANEPWKLGDADSLIKEVADKYQRIGENLEFIPGNIGCINYKPIALTRLLYNLIDNSLKHGEGRVIIRSCHTQESQEIQVSTATCSAPAQSGMYTRLLTFSGGQSGLGQKIIARLAEVHHANIQVDTHRTDQMVFRIIFKRNSFGNLPERSQNNAAGAIL